MTSPARTLTDADVEAIADALERRADAFLDLVEARAAARAAARQRPKPAVTVPVSETDRAAVAAWAKRIGLRKRA